MSIVYHSTRGQAPEQNLHGVTMTGLAPDGGLYVPTGWPSFDHGARAAMIGKPYTDIAFQVLRPFMAGVLSDDVLRDMLHKTYAVFPDAAVTPLRQLDNQLWVLELFHGPTLAFKDIALQFLGHMFECFLAQSGERITVIGATSGDTGSAAMAALAGRKNIDVVILYPAKGPSDIQRKQMTCIDAPNVHAVAIDGTFDDCQAIVKSLFNDTALRRTYNFAAINSINWLRILGQMVYYFAASSQFDFKPISFVVPTGNFGNVYAAYAASRCDLPVAKLAVASNRNDILTRFFATGRMKAEAVQSSLSPSMDIQISSNFERLLFDLCDHNGDSVRAKIDSLNKTGAFSVSAQQLDKAHAQFTAARCDDEQTLQIMADVYKESGYILDPHSAVGVGAARRLAKDLPQPIVSLACAHPAKFPDTVRRAIGLTPALPDSVAALLKKPERTTTLPVTIDAVTNFISQRIKL